MPGVATHLGHQIQLPFTHDQGEEKLLQYLVRFDLGNGQRRVGLVDRPLVREIQGATSTRDMALVAINKRISSPSQAG